MRKFLSLLAVIPAKAGIQVFHIQLNKRFKTWIPAFAGMTTVGVFLLISSSSHAAWDEPPAVSTDPIGSPFYRHLAQQANLDLRTLVRFEKRGFGRNEICSLVLLSSATHVDIKDYGKRRLKDKVTIQQFADEGHVDYDDLMTRSREMKRRIEAMGDRNLPPPVYPEPSPSETPDDKKEKGKKQK